METSHTVFEHPREESSGTKQKRSTKFMLIAFVGLEDYADH